MALIECKNCGNKVSEYAKTCPKCSTEVGKKEVVKTGELILEKKEKVITLGSEGPEKIVKDKKLPHVEKGSKKKIVIVIVVVVLAILSTVLIMNSLNADNTSSDYENQNNQTNDRHSNNNQDDSFEEIDDSNEPTERDIKEEKQKEKEQKIKNEQEKEDIKKEIVREDINSYVTLSINNYKQKLLGGIKNLKLTISNTSDYSMAKVQVKVQYFKLNDKLYTTKYVDFYGVGANSRMSLFAPETEFGTYVRCQIVEINAPDLD